MWGVLLAIRDADLRALDRYEAVDEGMYRREVLTIDSPEHGPVGAWVYLARADPTGPTPPSRRYLQTLLRGGRHHDLPAAYLDALARTATLD